MYTLGNYMITSQQIFTVHSRVVAVCVMMSKAPLIIIICGLGCFMDEQSTESLFGGCRLHFERSRND